MTSVETANNDLNFKINKKMMNTDQRSVEGVSLKMSNGYDIEKSIT
jgi:hypothetical protein